MAKLNRVQKRTIERALAAARAAQADILDERTVLMHDRRLNEPITTLDVKLPDGRVVTEMEKYGRNFVQLGTAIETLTEFVVEYG